MLAAQKAVQQDGGNAHYRHLYGMTLLQLNQYSDAEPELRKALALDPGKADFHYGVAALILQQRSETEDPTDPMGMGARNETSEPVEEGIRLLEKVLELDPGHLKARMHLGRTYHQQNMRSKALRQFEAVVARNPRYAWAHYHLAAIYLDAGRFREALQALQQEVEDHPDAGQARLELADLLLQLGKPKLALSHLTAVSPESQTVSLPDLHFGLAKVYRRLGQLDKAIAATRQSIRLLPDNPVAHRLLAGLYRDAGQSEQARQALNSYRELKERIERYSR
jgi:tetratricopeptide (TPR) repeat protein